jgi:tetratricopeptide (TPR) repeat protein
MLAKVIGTMLPAALLLLDHYPLRRLTGRTSAKEARAVLLEKLPFLIPALAIGITGLVALFTVRNAPGLQTHGVWVRLWTTVFGAGFYLRKTILPLGLSPIYLFPYGAAPWPREVALAAAWMVVAAWGLTAAGVGGSARRSLWAYYFLLLLPVIGLLQHGPQAAADRFSYLACLGWALALGAAVARFSPAGLVWAGAWLVLLGGLTWRQCAYWRDDVVLWERAAAITPDAPIVQVTLATVLTTRGRLEEAEAHLRRSLELKPGDTAAMLHLGYVLLQRGRMEETGGTIVIQSTATEIRTE